MKKNVLVYSLALVIAIAPMLIMSSCNKDDDDDDLVGNWVKASPFGGYARSEAVTFTINDVVYVGLGASKTERFLTFYKYDVGSDYWTTVDTFPGLGRTSAVAFAIGGKGYVTTGLSDNSEYLKDMYVYDPNANDWAKSTTDFPGTARNEAFAFVINDVAYVGGGYDDNYLNDFYSYNGSNWEQLASLKGDKRTQATTFVLNGMGYVVSGNNNGSALNDMQKWDPGLKTWTTMRKLTNVDDDDFDDDYSSIIRNNGVALVMNGKAYLTTGENGGLNSHTWEYNDGNDTWDEKTGFEGSGRTGAIAFVANNRGFVLLGRSGGSTDSGAPYDNMYEWQPNAEQDDDDN